MGQSASTKEQTLNDQNHNTLPKSTSASSTIGSTTFKPRKHLTRIELVSLQYIFQELTSNFSDGFSCIEPKKFLVSLLP
jgi:hypothetical protein